MKWCQSARKRGSVAARVLTGIHAGAINLARSKPSVPRPLLAHQREGSGEGKRGQAGDERFPLLHRACVLASHALLLSLLAVPAGALGLGEGRTKNERAAGLMPG